MQITVNDRVTAVADALNLIQLIHALSLDEAGLALAVNKQVINRSLWSEFTLHPNDNVTIFTVVAGG